jgi:pimeloyl-ACP methyl ester carboxylesterase
MLRCHGLCQVLLVHTSIADEPIGRHFRISHALTQRNTRVWGLDFYAFGASDRYPEMNESAAANPSLCRAAEASEQIAAAVRFFLNQEGAFNDIIHAWHGDLGYDPARVATPVALIRGEWDGVIPDEDARWLFDAFTAAPVKRDIKIGRATRLMHLEAMRHALYRESIGFLMAGDRTPVPPLGGRT